MTSSARRKRAPGVLWREGEFGVVLLPPGPGEPQTLTGSGPALWHALARPITASELVAELAETFGVDPGVVEADIAPVLSKLSRIGALDGGSE
ncbi:MAG: PqqD family protein [Acidimicrobiia bacterium]